MKSTSCHALLSMHEGQPPKPPKSAHHVPSSRQNTVQKFRERHLSSFDLRSWHPAIRLELNILNIEKPL